MIRIVISEQYRDHPHAEPLWKAAVKRDGKEQALAWSLDWKAAVAGAVRNYRRNRA